MYVEFLPFFTLTEEHQVLNSSQIVYNWCTSKFWFSFNQSLVSKGLLNYVFSQSL